jgi:microcystin-dependent protein
MFGGNFAPQGWAFCDGSLLPIGQNDALFSLIGTTYGGDGQQTFALPDLRGRLPVSQGAGPGLSPYAPGQPFGAESVTLTAAQTAGHSHPVSAASTTGTGASPVGTVPAAVSAGARYASGPPTPGVQLNAQALAPSAGGAQPHDNRMPSLCVSFVICTEGIYPTQG